MFPGMRKKRSDVTDEAPSADLLPVMNIMFLLIPALLLAMEFASMAQIHVTPPRVSDNVTAGTPPKEQNFDLKVVIRSDGFLTTVNGATQGPAIPLQDGALDYPALTAAVRELKVAHPDTDVVTVSAENQVPLQSVVATLDALRGPDCRLANTVRLGEKAPDSCLFWNTVIASS